MGDHSDHCACVPSPRRRFLADAGMGFVSLALGSDASSRRHRPGRRGHRFSPPDGKPHFPPRAQRVIWLMMRGGVSHLESFDPKPELTRHAGKTISESPHNRRSSARLSQERPRAGRQQHHRQDQGQDLSDPDRLQAGGPERYRG